jgi:hypothetical protein
MGFLKRKKKEELEEMNKGGDEEKEIGDWKIKGDLIVKN